MEIGSLRKTNLDSYHPVNNLPCHAPTEIVLPSTRLHSTCGRGLPVAAHRNRKCAPSCTIIGRSDSGKPAPKIARQMHKK